MHLLLPAANLQQLLLCFCTYSIHFRARRSCEFYCKWEGQISKEALFLFCNVATHLIHTLTALPWQGLAFGFVMFQAFFQARRTSSARTSQVNLSVYMSWEWLCSICFALSYMNSCMCWNVALIRRRLFAERVKSVSRFPLCRLNVHEMRALSVGKH
jgi:hypothetical protein